MESQLVAVVKSWVQMHAFDVFSFAGNVKTLITERSDAAHSAENSHDSMIELFLDKSSFPIEYFPPNDEKSFVKFLCLNENSIYRKFAILYFLIDEFTLVKGRSIEDVYHFANLIFVSKQQVNFVHACINMDSSISTPSLVPALAFQGLPSTFEIPIFSSLIDKKMYQDAYQFYLCKKPVATSFEDQSLVVNCYAYNGFLFDALKYIRSIANEERRNELLSLLFKTANQIGQDYEFSNLPLNSKEIDYIINLEFPSKAAYKRFCTIMKRFDKFDEGKVFVCNF